MSNFLYLFFPSYVLIVNFIILTNAYIYSSFDCIMFILFSSDTGFCAYLNLSSVPCLYSLTTCPFFRVLIIEDGLWEQTFNVAVNVVILLAFFKKNILFFSPIIMGLLPKLSSRFSTKSWLLVPGNLKNLIDLMYFVHWILLNLQ